jgi:leucyl-tRNA synthetase
VQSPFPPALAALEGQDVFLTPATLRPETMYGQTNCFVLPEGDYGAFKWANGEIYVMSARSAKGLSFQSYQVGHRQGGGSCRGRGGG